VEHPFLSYFYWIAPITSFPPRPNFKFRTMSTSPVGSGNAHPRPPGWPLRVRKHHPLKNGKIALQTPRTSRLSTFCYCQVVDTALLKSLNVYILVLNRILANYNIKLSNILYHWQSSISSFRLCETYLLHIKLFVVNNSVISPFLGGSKKRHSPRSRQIVTFRCVSAEHTHT